MSTPVSAENLWRKGDGSDVIEGTELVNDIDAISFENIVDPLDRVLSNYNRTVLLKYNSTSQVTLSLGEIVCSNTAGTIRRMRKNTSDVTVTWADIDAGAEAGNTTYYIYSVCDADAATFTATISTNSSTPTGATYFKRVGQFTNDGSSNITAVKNDDDRVIVSTGTVANGGTISLPSGWAQDECDWTVGGPATAVCTDGDGETSGSITISVTSGRVATCIGTQAAACSVGSKTCSANFIIACYR